MENEKRKVGDYTILCAVNIGSREIILAENEQSANGERFLCCYGERNDIFEKFTECAVGDDYIDAAMFFAERIKQDADLRADATHHDGTNHYLYRVFKDGVSETQMENLRDKIYHGKATRADITRLTRRLGDEIAAVYGFDIPKQRTPQERGAR